MLIKSNSFSSEGFSDPKTAAKLVVFCQLAKKKGE